MISIIKHQKKSNFFGNHLLPKVLSGEATFPIRRQCARKNQGAQGFVIERIQETQCAYAIHKCYNHSNYYLRKNSRLICIILSLFDTRTTNLEFSSTEPMQEIHKKFNFKKVSNLQLFKISDM